MTFSKKRDLILKVLDLFECRTPDQHKYQLYELAEIIELEINNLEQEND